MMSLRLFLVALMLFSFMALGKGHWVHDQVDTLAARDNKVYAYLRQALFFSDNYGQTFQYMRRFKTFRNSYIGLSKYDGKVAFKSNNTLFTTTDNINWVQTSIDTCRKVYFDTHRKGVVFTPDKTMLVAGSGKVSRQFADGSIAITSINDPGCPHLSAVDDTNIVYLGVANKLQRSVDGGATWTGVTTTTSPIVEVLAIDKTTVFVLTESIVCLVDLLANNNNSCNDVQVPTATTSEMFESFKDSKPTAMAYYDGMLTVLLSNSRAFKVSQDLGTTWFSRNKDNQTHICCPIHLGEGFECKFGAKEHWQLAENQYVAGFAGLYLTEDDGSFWTYRPTISTTGNQLSLAKDSSGNDEITLTTYQLGAFQGSPSNLKYRPAASGHTGGLGLEPFNQWFYSPFYASDGIAFQAQESRLEFSDGSCADDFCSYSSRNIQSLIFSPTFNQDDTIYLAGYNMGVKKSTNQGINFFTMQGTEEWDVQKMGISPTFTSDRCMACMIEENDVKVTSDAGDSWKSIVNPSLKLRDMIVVGNDSTSNGGPFIVAIDDDRNLYAADCDGSSPFKPIMGTAFPSTRPLGYFTGGMAVSPSGTTFLASFREGGQVLGTIVKDGNSFAIENRYFSLEDPFQTPKTMIPRSSGQTQEIRRRPWRSFGDLIVFSPDFENDGTIYAAGYTNLWKSTDRGYNWDLAFQLPQDRYPITPSKTPAKTPAPVPPPTPPCIICSDIETPWMKNNSWVCNNFTYGINNFCSGWEYWDINKFCQQSCYSAGKGYVGDTCCDCTPCSNVRPFWMKDYNLTCETFTDLKDKCKYQPWWVENNFCQQSCHAVGSGYVGDKCCQ